MRFRVGLALAAVMVLSMASRAADSALGVVRTGIEQWVQTKQLISRTVSDWEAEKDMLSQSKALFERELTGIDEQMSKVSTNSTQVDRERAGAERELGESNAALEKSRVLLGEIEGKIRGIVPRLPEPLVDTIRPLLGKVPEDAASSKVAVTERAQTVVSLLNEIDKFNNSLSVFSEKRPNARGEEVAVETVYVGLGTAYFVNQSGDFAGTGRPGPKGWEWAIDASLAPTVRDVVRIYRNEKTATFVALPVSLQ